MLQRVLSIYKEFLFRFQGFLFPIPGIISLQHTIIGLCNLITGILRIAEDGLPEGKLTATNITLIMGVMFMVIVVAVLIQKAREKRSED